MNLLDAEPMVSLDKFMEQTGRGLSALTLWRYQKKDVNDCKYLRTPVYPSSRDRAFLINVRLPVTLLSHQLDPGIGGDSLLFGPD